MYVSIIYTYVANMFPLSGHLTKKKYYKKFQKKINIDYVHLVFLPPHPLLVPFIYERDTFICDVENSFIFNILII